MPTISFTEVSRDFALRTGEFHALDRVSPDMPKRDAAKDYYLGDLYAGAGGVPKQ
ncbi:hypothetical protein [Embleya sp. NPDC059259]|uniref:hypothetical protein n=1 Tax=unclassified Embleya TaxID=2699296 RepID=UPI00369751DE